MHQGWNKKWDEWVEADGLVKYSKALAAEAANASGGGGPGAGAGPGAERRQGAGPAAASAAAATTAAAGRKRKLSDAALQPPAEPQVHHHMHNQALGRLPFGQTVMVHGPDSNGTWAT